MKFYFSGIASKDEYKMLEEAGVKHLLVDQFDFANLPANRKDVALDSGAYRYFKQGTNVNVESYVKFVEENSPFDFVVAPDVVNDPQQSDLNWKLIQGSGIDFIPVWQWGASIGQLHRYLDQSFLVGIGGLVKLMREDENEEALTARNKMLDELLALANQFPNRFHIFGCNWLKAIEQLKDLVYSADSSVWLRGGRYGFIIFQHSKNKHLTQAPARCIPLYSRLDRRNRCIKSALNIETFVNSRP